MNSMDKKTFRLKPDDKKAFDLSIQITQRQREHLERQASSAGLNLSKYVRAVLTGHAPSDQTSFRCEAALMSIKAQICRLQGLYLVLFKTEGRTKDEKILLNKIFKDWKEMTAVIDELISVKPFRLGREIVPFPPTDGEKLTARLHVVLSVSEALEMFRLIMKRKMRSKQSEAVRRILQKTSIEISGDPDFVSACDDVRVHLVEWGRSFKNDFRSVSAAELYEIKEELMNLW